VGRDWLRSRLRQRPQIMAGILTHGQSRQPPLLIALHYIAHCRDMSQRKLWRIAPHRTAHTRHYIEHDASHCTALHCTVLRVRTRGIALNIAPHIMLTTLRCIMIFDWHCRCTRIRERTSSRSRWGRMASAEALRAGPRSSSTMDSAVLRCAALCCTMDVIPNASEYPVPYLIYVQQQQQQDAACANVWLQLSKEKGYSIRRS
jgi:hypothetical protein